MRQLRGLTVLILDDELSKPLCGLVRAAGGICEAYASYAEARERLAEDPEFFDVAVIDLHLLNGKGSDLIRELRISNPRLPCVLLSGMDRQTVMREDLECTFLAKPVEAREFYATIIRAVEDADTMPPRTW